MRTIVLAWIDQRSATYGKPQACVWKLEGTARDLRKAREHAAEHYFRVFVYRITEPFPLRSARASL